MYCTLGWQSVPWNKPYPPPYCPPTLASLNVRRRVSLVLWPSRTLARDCTLPWRGYSPIWISRDPIYDDIVYFVQLFTCTIWCIHVQPCKGIRCMWFISHTTMLPTFSFFSRCSHYIMASQILPLSYIYYSHIVFDHAWNVRSHQFEHTKYRGSSCDKAFLAVVDKMTL